jgi:TldD protein
MGLTESFFGQRFNITERDLESYLSEALSAGGEYADLYFEYLATTSIGIDEQIVKTATEGVTRTGERGEVGLRANAQA